MSASLGVRIEAAAGKGYGFAMAAESLPRRLVHLGSAKAGGAGAAGQGGAGRRDDGVRPGPGPLPA
ncbi:hypothetical protein, partial [Streptomyces sp. T21Q-yed]|uniref:hypothetical protein n=1 Tax=Streptomyces sp. T21Q-yed TaxID=3018441 RepID=UPI0023E01DF0